METLQETDVYKVPLRTYLWLLVPAVVGVGIGALLAHRAIGGPIVHSAAPRPALVDAHPQVVPPRRVYRSARPHTHVGLTPLLRSTSDLMAAGVSEGSLSALAGSRAAGEATVSRNDSNVVTFAAEPRTFAEETHATTFDTSGAPSTTTATTTDTPPAAPVNTTPIEITDVHTTSLSPFSATIAFHTSEPVSGQVAYGLDAETLWTAWDSPSTDHVAVVNGLSYNLTYQLSVNAHSADGRAATSPFLLTTPPLTGTQSSGTSGGSLQIDGEPFFPTMVWSACPDVYDSELAVGIDLFMGKDCGSGAKQLGALANRAFLITDAQDPATPGAIGSFLPDEWDTHLPNDLTSAAVQKMAPDNGGGPRFLTLTNHFYSNAAPLPQGRGMYPALIANADVIGFDLYPLQNWCRYDDFGHVFDSQRELVKLAAGKPTFQWIEARSMDCHDPTLDPTAATVHAETWLAIAGGAHAIGYFPYYWSPEIGAQIAADKRQMQSLVPALLDDSIEASSTAGPVRVGARRHNGAIYVIAVNASRSTTTATVTVPSLGERQLSSLDHTRFVTPAGGAFTDTFGPLEVHVYVAAPTAP